MSLKDKCWGVYSWVQNGWQLLSNKLHTFKFFATYRIVENVRGRKISQKSQNWNFRRKTFTDVTLPYISIGLYTNTKCSREIFSRMVVYLPNSQKFSPAKISRYTVKKCGTHKSRTNSLVAWLVLSKRMPEKVYAISVLLNTSATIHDGTLCIG